MVVRGVQTGVAGRNGNVSRDDECDRDVLVGECGDENMNKEAVKVCRRDGCSGVQVGMVSGSIDCNRVGVKFSRVPSMYLSMRGVSMGGVRSERDWILRYC